MKKFVILILGLSIFLVNFSVLAVDGDSSERQEQLQSSANNDKTDSNVNKELGEILVLREKLKNTQEKVISKLSKYFLKTVLVTGAKLSAFAAICYGAYKIGDKTGFNKSLMSFVKSDPIYKILLGAGAIVGVTGVTLSVPVILSYFDKNFYQNYGDIYAFCFAGPLVAFTAFASLLVLLQV